jgi:hypothetical protein
MDSVYSNSLYRQNIHIQMFQYQLDIIAENEPAFIPQDYKIKQKSSPKSPQEVIYSILIFSIDSKCNHRFAQNL